MSPTKNPQLANLCGINVVNGGASKKRHTQAALRISSKASNDVSIRVAFLNTLPEEEWERYQSERERKTGEVWTGLAFMESTWDVIRRYGTQSAMRMGLNQPIMRE